MLWNGRRRILTRQFSRISSPTLDTCTYILGALGLVVCSWLRMSVRPFSSCLHRFLTWCTLITSSSHTTNNWWWTSEEENYFANENRNTQHEFLCDRLDSITAIWCKQISSFAAILCDQLSSVDAILCNQLASVAAIAHQLMPWTVYDSCAVCCALTQLQPLPPYGNWSA